MILQSMYPEECVCITFFAAVTNLGDKWRCFEPLRQDTEVNTVPCMNMEWMLNSS